MDNVIARYIRPGIILYLIALFSVISIADALTDKFNMRDVYIDVYAAILQAAVGFYFTSRGVEKSVKIYRGNVDPIDTKSNKGAKDTKDAEDTKDTEFIDVKDTIDKYSK